MTSALIIVFREILEAALILGVISAATQGLKGRKKIILAGISLGVLGALILAALTNTISSLVDGMGQEIFNALILIAASLMISWTVIWMQSHGRELANKIKQAGQAVGQGDLPQKALIAIIALAILREGAEIVLFLFGMLASGQSALSIGVGALIGTFCGIFAGFFIYFGLIKISTKYMFKVTGWLLILLSCAMMSHGATYLAAAGFLPEINPIIWDSSWILSQSSPLGVVLHSLIGYSDQPSGIQLLIYVLNLGGLLTIIRLTSRSLNAN